MQKQLIVFNKDGTKVGSLEIPISFYLETEKEWIEKQLLVTRELDGIALIVDWQNKSIICTRQSQ